MAPGIGIKRERKEVPPPRDAILYTHKEDNILYDYRFLSSILLLVTRVLLLN